MKKTYFSKFLALFLLLLVFVGLTGCKDDEEQDDTPSGDTNDGGGTNDGDNTDGGSVDGGNTDGNDEEAEAEPVNAVVYFHYKRNNSDYDRWQLWLWAEEGDAIDYEGKDDFGVYFRIDLTDPTSYFYEATTLGYIYRLGEWEAKDKVANDRFVTVTEAMVDDNQEIHLYSFEGKETIFLDKEGSQPVYEITGFMLSQNGRQVEYSANARGQKYIVYRNGEVYDEGKMLKNTGSVTLPEKFNLKNKDVYELEIVFDDEVSLRTDLNISNYYDSNEFIKNYVYDGNDLGVTVKDGKTTFKLWAPASRSVQIELFKTGHPTKHGTTEHPGDDKPTKTFDMELGEKGVWSYTADEDLTGWYYTYTVTNGYKKTKAIVDPYAYATGINGLRGYIVDFSKLNPEGWDYNRKSLYTPNELVVYEIHVRDLTMDDTWGGTAANRGKFLGMCETGTTFTYGTTEVTTGFDHIKELGVNAVQILPFFDASNKEQREDQFNWGYNPQNYNVLEGQYSTNPYDAECRIREFKQMVKAYHDAGIEIIMDVVYNHMSGITGSSFHKILPGYYFRYDAKGLAYNGSGCGNDVATERAMVRKYIVDSVKFWANEYNIKGFRFDLMALIDIETMNAVDAALSEIDPNIVMYGEPWASGATGIGSATQSNRDNSGKFPGIGMFSDSFRENVKGNNDGNGAGWVQGSGSNLTNALQGTILRTQGGNPSSNSVTQQVNYVTCHDNLSLADKLRKCGIAEYDLGKASVLANGLVLTSEGITFMHGGAELLRSKPIYKNGIWTGEYSHNSYNLPDESNSLKWENKVKYAEAYDAYKDLVHISVNQSAFHISQDSVSTANYQIKKQSKETIVVEVTTPTNMKDSDDWSKITVIYSSAAGANSSYTLTGTWNVACVSGTSNAIEGQTITGNVTAGAYSIVVLYQE